MESLARVDWHLGQILRPEDFESLEESLSEELRARAEAPGLPAYGWLELEWDPGDLSRGILRLERATAAMPGGPIVRSSDNLSLPEPVKLKAAGTPEVDVYFHVLAAEPTEGQRAGAVGTPRITLRSELSFKEASARGRSLHVGRFETRDGKAFHVAPAAVPPLLRLRSTPHLHARLVGLRDRLTRYSDELRKHVAQARRSAGPTQAFLRGRAEVMKAVALLDDALLDAPQGAESRSHARLHPYTVLAALRSLLVELHLVEGTLPDGLLPRYDHDNLGGLFGDLIYAIEARIDGLPLTTPTIQLVESEGRFVAQDIPEDVLDAPEIYLVIERPTPYGEMPLERYNVRLGEPSRLPWINQHSTRGIRPARTSASPADFGARFDVYALPKPDGKQRQRLEGHRVDTQRMEPHRADTQRMEPHRADTQRIATLEEEWKYVRASRSIGFLRPKELEGIRAALYWTYPASTAR
ncbi:type VI secretion system baseplate subunit TssK [Sorangium sp. So ce426]|uniref:type VI secretion system baseplate subunit TssK n=1 Tax=unclassified Sorangium TaxID=2621164 RepID=UPI003F5B0314